MKIKTFADFFCGVGGFHIATKHLGLKCVFACDIDKMAQDVYEKNFGLRPFGDITKLSPMDVPKHDILFAGFPCQPFSIIGKQKGFDDEKNGNLFFDLVKIIKGKKPKAIILENVKQLATINGGKIMTEIIKKLSNMGYSTDWRVLNALDYGLPQKRERVFIVGALKSCDDFDWHIRPRTQKTLKDVLEDNPDKKHFASQKIKKSRKTKHRAKTKPSIWHENKGGNISSHPFSCALRAGASHNYLLVNGERRLTPREMFRLQGFPDNFMLADQDSQARKQAGNAVPVPLARGVIKGVLKMAEKKKEV